MSRINIIKNIKIIIIIFIFFYYSYIIWNNRKEDISYCESELDPFYAFKKILNSSPIILCKSEDSEHFCYQNNFSFFAKKKGVICLMKNFYINTAFWKEDGYSYDKGPINEKTRGAPLISEGFFNMKCNLKFNFTDYNKIYNTYFQSWNYSININNINKNDNNKEELFPGKTVFLLSRNQDSPNLLIGGCQFLNAFSIMHLLNLKPENIQILFLESMNLNYDPYYNLYKNIISRGGIPIHIRDLNLNKIYHISNGIHIPLNWDSPCFCKTQIPNCTTKTRTYKYFYESIFKYMNIPLFIDDMNYNEEVFYYPKSYKNSNLKYYKKFMTIQWRKPWPKNRKGQNRILGNGPKLVEKLDNVLKKHNILVRLVDTAYLPIETQISIIQKTDYFLGIHGAGLFLSIYLPFNAIVHEIKSKKKKVPNRPQIIGIVSGHKVYSDFINITIKTIDFQEKYFINEDNLIEKVLNHMNENNFF